DVGEPAVAHAGGTGAFAGAAGEAAIEMQPRALGDLGALQRALDEVDAAARAVEVVAEELVGRAGRGAETAMHALAQDGVGLAPLVRIADELGELRLHR